MASQTQSKKLGDFLKYELNSSFNREEGTVKNSAGSAASLTESEVIGFPVKKVSGQWELLEATDEANAGGILIGGDAIESLGAGSTTTEKYPILVRGPAIVNQDEMPADDGLDVSFTIADLVTAYEGLNIVSKSEPAVTETQTT